MESVIFLVIGVVLGIILGYFISNSKKTGAEGRMAVLEDSVKRAEAENRLLQEKLEKERADFSRDIRMMEAQKGKFEESSKRVPFLEEELTNIRETVKNLTAENKALTERYNSEKESMETRLKELKDARDALTKEFENIANKIFEDKNRTFSDQSRQNLEALLKPFKENINEFKTRVESIYTEETKDRASLKTELQTLLEMNKQLSEGAQNLTEALKGDNKVLGDWGEVILERILETSGLEKGREYQTQFSTTDSEGTIYRPDAVIFCPGTSKLC
jgi:Uncharacterized protein conserved in bacteria